MPAFRASVERRSAVLLAWLSLRPRLLLPAVVLGLLLLSSFLAPPLSTVCLALVLAVVGWLSYLSWPVLDGRARTLRVAVLALLTGLLVLGVT